MTSELDLELPAEKPRCTEADMLDALHDRFGFVSHNGGFPKRRFVCADHVRATSGFFDRGDPHARTLDFVAVDTWASGKLARHGAEVKVTRSDWLREMKDPAKSAPFLSWLTHFWLAVPDASIVREGELPEGWGLLALRGQNLIAKVTAPRREAAPIPPQTVASLLTAVSKTAATRGLGL